MWSKILLLILTLGFPLGNVQQRPSTIVHESVDLGELYLPFIAVTQPPPPPPPGIYAWVVETARFSTGGGWPIPTYPIYYYLYGYVESLVSAPVYSATVGIEVCSWSYIDPTTCSIHAVQPAFPVTLPGQINPFGHMTWEHYKGGSYMRSLSLLDTGYLENGPDVYYPITIVQSTVEDGNVMGTARNDSNWTLYDVRVIAFGNRCGWREQTLANTTLQPGEEVTFSQVYHCEMEDLMDLMLVGQGKTVP
jgi:hypothetical protein